MRSASALRFSKGCSSLNLDRMMMVCFDVSLGRGVLVYVVKRLASGGFVQRMEVAL